MLRLVFRVSPRAETSPCTACPSLIRPWCDNTGAVYLGSMLFPGLWPAKAACSVTRWYVAVDPVTIVQVLLAHVPESGVLDGSSATWSLTDPGTARKNRKC